MTSPTGGWLSSLQWHVLAMGDRFVCVHWACRDLGREWKRGRGRSAVHVCGKCGLLPSHRASGRTRSSSSQNQAGRWPVRLFRVRVCGNRGRRRRGLPRFGVPKSSCGKDVRDVMGGWLQGPVVGKERVPLRAMACWLKFEENVTSGSPTAPSALAAAKRFAMSSSSASRLVPLLQSASFAGPPVFGIVSRAVQCRSFPNDRVGKIQTPDALPHSVAASRQKKQKRSALRVAFPAFSPSLLSNASLTF